VLGGAALALALPVDASPAALTLAVPAASTAAERSDGLTASRSAARAPAQAPASPAVSAPEGSAPIAPAPVGVSGGKAVAKPAPEPAAAKAAAGSTAAAAPSGSYSTSISGKCGGIGLIPTAARLCSAVDSVFHLGSIGGYRPNGGEHSTGQAVDFMISSSSQGDAIAAWVQSHVGEFNVKYIIWQQRYWAPGGSWELMEDRGSPTANHMDHVHVTVNN
jgi:hypothetical protein